MQGRFTSVGSPSPKSLSLFCKMPDEFAMYAGKLLMFAKLGKWDLYDTNLRNARRRIERIADDEHRKELTDRLSQLVSEAQEYDVQHRRAT